MKNILLWIVLIGSVAVLSVFARVFVPDIFSKKSVDVPKERACSMEAKLCSDGSVVGRSGPKCEFAPCPNGLVENENVLVTTPLPNQVVSNPLVVTGSARGTWYFEASFPVSLVDGNGKVLGRGIAQAKDEWMTPEFVPFEARIDFDPPTTMTGFLILSKDNPSGLSENDAEVKFPIRF